ncbi:MAG TPA: ABC transporter permease [Terracidiphilus sp.]|nr:ABC transporter permease [Terracidiphilus sp.]
MRNVLLIAKREYLQQIRGRAFKFSTVLLPLGILLMLGAMYFTGRNAAAGQHVAIAADSAPLAGEMRRQLLEDKIAKFTVDVVAPATQQDRDALLKLVQSKAIDGLLTIENSSTGSPTATYASPSALDYGTSVRLKYVLNRALLHERLNARGLKPDETDALLKEVSVENLHLNKEGKAAKSTGMAAFSKALTMAFLLTMPILLYGMDMARSIIEEKSSRIFEVMLAVVRPDDLLTGKLLGVGAVGLTQIAIWVVATALLTGSALAAPLLSGDFALHFSWEEGLLFPVYYVLGFFLFSSLFSGLAATCESAQELQMFMPLAIVPVWLSFGILPYLLNNPSSVWVIALSLFPPTAPFVMVPRIGLETVPLWQIAASVILMILGIWGTLWFSSRLYRVGILMYGKRATLPELVRWLRYS